jgi:hypothetical protein
MALPTSGPLSFSAIAEQLSAQSPYSLRSMSSDAGFQTPDTVSDFYGYGPSECPAYGTFLYSSCNGCEEIYHYADGSCGEYTEIVDYNSPNCGCGGGLTLFFISIPTSVQSKICSNNYPCCMPVWHNGASALPTIEDFVYTDSEGTTPLTSTGGENWFGMDTVECNPAINWLEIDRRGRGIVVDTGSCF